MTLQVPEPIPVEVADDPAPLRPPPETEFVEAGKLTMGQLAQAHRDRLETGKHVLDIIVERGWVSAEEVAELREAYGIQAPPAPPVEVTPESGAPPSAATCVSVAIRLTNGDLITAGEADDSDKASALALAVVADLTSGNGEWPFFGGRYINPETIVSVDLVPQEQAV